MREQIERVMCDKCGKVDVPGIHQIVIPYDISNVAGCDKCRVADLCPSCMAYVLMKALKRAVRTEGALSSLWGGITWREELR